MPCRVVLDPNVVPYLDLVKTCFMIYKPTEGMRQGDYIGSQFRSAMYYFSGTGRDGPSAGRRLRHLHAVPGGGSTATELVPAALSAMPSPTTSSILALPPTATAGTLPQMSRSRRQLQSSVVSAALV